MRNEYVDLADKNNRYRIILATDKEGNEKPLPDKNMQAEYVFEVLMEDYSALLLNVNKEIDHIGMQTSIVESIFDNMDGNLEIRTMNTAYHFEIVKDYLDEEE